RGWSPRPTVRDGRSSAVPREVAIGKAEPRYRSAEAVRARTVQIEAGLHRQTPQRGANRLASDLQRVGRQVRMTHLACTLELDGAGHRPIGIHAAKSACALETGVVEHLPDDETAGFFTGPPPARCPARGQRDS